MDSFGLKSLDAIHIHVRDLERTRRFHTGSLGFAETARSTPESEREEHQRSVLLEAGAARILVSQPAGGGSRAAAWLARHPDGVAALQFEVEDAEKALRVLESRGATPVSDIRRFRDDGGSLSVFAITTPFGDCEFRFVERRGFRSVLPGLQTLSPEAGANPLAIRRFDHVTSNFRTMKPALLWLEHVLGMERFWDVAFHTRDVNGRSEGGSGLRSAVMIDRTSGVKLANNEPLRPTFPASQIWVFTEDLRGDGIQHVALEVADILSAVREMRRRGVEFMRTPGAYYDLMPARLARLAIEIREDPAELRELEVLVDGERPGEYMLQIFLKAAAAIHGDPSAGPFFYEIIQRRGGRGFGAGNFRALFESIEREQLDRNRG